MPLPGEQKNNILKGSLNIILNKVFKVLRLVIFILVVLIGYLIFVQPKFNSVKEQKQIMLQEQAGELNGLEVYTQRLQELQSVIDNFKKTQAQNLDKLAQMLPTGASVPNLMAQLEALAQTSGFSINSFNVAESQLQKGAQPTETKEGVLDIKQEAVNLSKLNQAIHSLSVTLILSGGDYLEFKKLLDNLEKHLRLLDVNSISFSGEGEKGAYNLSLTAYYYEPKS